MLLLKVWFSQLLWPLVSPQLHNWHSSSGQELSETQAAASFDVSHDVWLLQAALLTVHLDLSGIQT